MSITIPAKMCTDLISAHYNDDEDKFKEIVKYIYISNYNDPEIVFLIKAHKDHDEEKFAQYCRLLAVNFRKNNNNMAADIIMVTVAEGKAKKEKEKKMKVISISGALIGALVESHFNNDNEEFIKISKIIADTYRENGNNMAADIIMKSVAEGAAKIDN